MIDFGGAPLGLVVLGRLRRATMDQVVVANESARRIRWPAQVVADGPAYAGNGPLVGLLAGLTHCRQELAAVAACDMPYYPAALVRHMLSLAEDEGHDVVIPRHRLGLEPLCAVYRRGCAGPIEDSLARGQHRFAALLPALRVRYVEEAELEPWGDRRWMFFNVNSAAELAAARRHSALERPGLGPEEEDDQQQGNHPRQQQRRGV